MDYHIKLQNFEMGKEPHRFESAKYRASNDVSMQRDKIYFICKPKH